MKKLLVFCLALSLFGCIGLKNKSPVSVTYSTFKTLEVVYVEGLSAAGDLYRQGEISDDQKADIIDLGKKFKLSYQTAAVAFETWVASPSLSNEKEMNRLLDNTNLLRDEFMRWIYERQE